MSPDPFRYFTVEGGDRPASSLRFRGQDRRTGNSGAWMPKKKRKKGAPRREMLLLCFLSALDVRRLEVVTLCFVTLMCLQSIAAGLEMSHRVAEIMIPSAQGLENPMNGVVGCSPWGC